MLVQSPVAATPMRAEFRRLLRENLWAAAAGAWVGLLVGGVGGRLAMLLLRLTSPDRVRGVESDDGFVIGQVTFDTLNLLLACTFIGAAAGTGYWLFRSAVTHRRTRLVSWTVFCGLLGGAALVQDGGVDFGLLEPLSLAVSVFILIPLVAGAGIALLADRWITSPGPVPRAAAALRLLPALSSLVVPVAPILALVGSGGWALLARLPGKIRTGARMLGVAAALGIASLSAVDLAQDLSTLAEM